MIRLVFVLLAILVRVYLLGSKLSRSNMSVMAIPPIFLNHICSLTEGWTAMGYQAYNRSHPDRDEVSHRLMQTLKLKLRTRDKTNVINLNRCPGTGEIKPKLLNTTLPFFYLRHIKGIYMKLTITQDGET